MFSKLLKEKIKNVDRHYSHPSYALERKLNTEIQLGLLEQATITLDQINQLERAFLAKNPVRSLKNSLIASCTLFTRAIIQAGVSSEDAFSLSDVFIVTIEEEQDTNVLQRLEYQMINEFIKLVHQSRLFKYPKPITIIISYIHEHITEDLTLATFSSLIDRSPDYISKLFIKEVGCSITDFVQSQKVAIAKYFLTNDRMSISEIAVMLSFCNPAYFTKVFIKHEHIPPSAYRKNNNSYSS